MPTNEELEACALVPLRQNVRWVHLPELFPSTVIEAERNPEHGRFGAVDLGSEEAARKVTEIHNAALQPKEPPCQTA